MEYIQRLQNNKIACQVKLEDLKHNSDISRIDQMDDRDRKRLKKYKEAIAYLETKSIIS